MTPASSEAGAVPTLTADDLISAVPQIADIANIRANTFRSLPSPEISFEDIEALSVRITEAAKAGSQGVVIIQGTDTLEESAFILDLLCDMDIPIVVTGAMRNPSLPGADGPSNILNAVLVASSKSAKVAGVIVVFNDEIHSAQFVRKTHTTNVATFKSDPLGPIGWVSENSVSIYMNPTCKIEKIVQQDDPTPVWVPMIKVGFGDSAKLSNLAVEAGADGIVVDALGGGHLPASIAEALKTASNTIPVILASRTGQGRVLTDTYGFAGSETDLLNNGLISAGRFDAVKARLYLLLLLRHTSFSNNGICLMFKENTV